jgi:hypothetical protein
MAVPVGDYPTECALCRLGKDRVYLNICVRVDDDGTVHKGAVCTECMRFYILELATMNPSEFEKLIEDARNAQKEG